MELCATQPISILTTNPTLLRPKPSLNLKIKLKSNTQFAFSSSSSSSRSLYLGKWVTRASMSDETSIGAIQFVADVRNSAVAVEDSPPPEKNVYETQISKEESPAAVDGQFDDFLSTLNIKFDTEYSYSILLYGGSALVTVWLAAVVVGAIDSIPLFPKLMEVVGLGYTFWFTTRYLLFKKNRDELATKIEELKQQILGINDD